MKSLTSTRCICLALISLSAPTIEGVRDRKSLEPHLEQVTGRESVISCGEYAISAPHSKEALLKSLACAEDSVRQHKPSRIVVQMQGADTFIAHGVVSDATGRVFFFQYLGTPCGGPGCEATFERKACRVSDVEVLAYGPGYYILGLKSR